MTKDALKSIKKVVVLAEEWLQDDNTPLGSTWEDLYAHVIDGMNDGFFLVSWILL